MRAADLPAGLVIFDCDGVLIDSEPISARVLAETLNETGLEISQAEAQARFTGAAESESATILRRDYGLAAPEAVMKRCEAALYHAFGQELRPVPGIEGLLAALDRPVCVASNSGVERLEKSLGLLPIRAYFGPHVYSAEMVARPKPAPDLVRLCLGRMGVAAREAVMIDDSPHGIAAAAAAGVWPIGFALPDDTRPGRSDALRAAGARPVVHSVAELAELLCVTLPA